VARQAGSIRFGEEEGVKFAIGWDLYIEVLVVVRSLYLFFPLCLMGCPLVLYMGLFFFFPLTSHLFIVILFWIGVCV